MTISAEAVAILKSLIDNPHHIEDNPALRELLEPRYAMGVAKVHATARGNLFLKRLDALATTEPVAAQAKPDLTGPPW